MRRNNPMKNTHLSKNLYRGTIRILCFCVFFLTIISCSQSENTPLEIGGFKFGSTKQEALNLAKKLGYEIKLNGEYHLYLTGAIQALDVYWDLMDICVDPVNGIKEIRLTRKNSSTTPEIKTNLYSAIKRYFPKSEQRGYIVSITGTDTNTGYSSTVQSDYATLFELIDERDEYNGSSYYILSRDEFSTVIGLTHTKNHLDNTKQ